MKNVDQISSLFSQSAYLIAENDSTDLTRKMLSDWGSQRPYFDLVTLAGLGKWPWRTLRLEYARNALVQLIRTWEPVRRFEFLFVLDFDDVNTYELDLDQLSRALDWMKARPDVAAIFPNQLGQYYDMWALRHPTYCPGDIWEEVFDYFLRHKCDDAAAFEATFAKRVFTLPPTAQPLQVDSAFGGLGIYRLDYYLRNPNPYFGQKIKVIRDSKKYAILRWQQCEHVHFHAGLGNLGGKLFVIPSLINRNTAGLWFDPSSFRKMAF